MSRTAPPNRVGTATVVRLSVTPVKSTAVHHPNEIRLERFGVPGNRRFYFVDERGRPFTGREHGPLAAIRARYEPNPERLAMRFPDGSVLDERVRTAERVVTVLWGRPVSGRVVDGPWTAALSGYVGRPVRVVRAEDPGGASDSHPASLISSASIKEVGRPDAGRIDPSRFRMLIELEGPTAFEEETWVSSVVRVGAAVLRIVRPTPRCVITSQDPATGEADTDMVAAIRERRGDGNGKAQLGVYADVVKPGELRVGDGAEMLDPQALDFLSVDRPNSRWRGCEAPTRPECIATGLARSPRQGDRGATRSLVPDGDHAAVRPHSAEP